MKILGSFIVTVMIAMLAVVLVSPSASAAVRLCWNGTYRGTIFDYGWPSTKVRFTVYNRGTRKYIRTTTWPALTARGRAGVRVRMDVDPDSGRSYSRFIAGSTDRRLTVTRQLPAHAKTLIEVNDNTSIENVGHYCRLR